MAWLSPEDAQRLRGSATGAEHDRAAREAIRHRRTHEVDQSGLIGAWPTELEGHAAALRASAGAKRTFDQGWQLATITDLRRVIAAQPTVFIDPLASETVDVGEDPVALARLALPLESPPPEIHAEFDEDQQTWSVASPNPNLRITGTLGAEVQPGVYGFGFFFEVVPSFLSVAEHQGRYILYDGYHRSYRLLSAGITAAPAFVRHFADDDVLFPTGMLPRQAYSGPGAPTLADYLDDRVSADIWYSPRPTSAAVSASPQTLAIGRIA